jgi:hypothetical protein
VKKEEPEEEWEQIPPELLEETRPWWVEHRELQAELSRHPDDPVDASGQTLAVAHSLAEAGGAAGGAPGGQPVFDVSDDSDEDVKPEVKMDDLGAGNSSGGRRYGSGRRGVACSRR